MKITKTRLKQIIKEELTKLYEWPEFRVELPPMQYKDDDEEEIEEAWEGDSEIKQLDKYGKEDMT